MWLLLGAIGSHYGVSNASIKYGWPYKIKFKVAQF